MFPIVGLRLLRAGFILIRTEVLRGHCGLLKIILVILCLMRIHSVI